VTTMQAFTDELARLRAARAPRTRRPILTILAVMAARAVAGFPRARTAVMSVAGFGCLVAAAWTVSMAAGLAAAGVSLLALEYLTDDGDRRR
jgi:uncharacterized membrane protein YdjX (TVP38/TMEM64 family)